MATRGACFMFAPIAVIMMAIMAVFPVFAGDYENSSGNGSGSNIITSVPRQMSYQGILKDSGGDPVTDSVYSVTFRILDADAVNVWSEVLPCTTLSGYFAALFSNVNIPFDEDYWLELEVDGEILTPPQKITMVGYSARADSSDYAAAGGGWVDDGLNVRLEASYDKVGIGTSTPTNKLHVTGSESVPILNVEQTGSHRAARFFSQNACALWVEHAGNHGLRVTEAFGDGVHIEYALNDGIHVDSSNNFAGYFVGRGYFSGPVGIATTSPEATLHVEGMGKFDSLMMPTGASNGYVLTSDGTGRGTWQAASGGSDSDWVISDTNMYSGVSGNVGIGTATPTEKLHIEGDIYASGKATIGPGNTNSGINSFVAGANNVASDYNSTVSGGSLNNAYGFNATVGGGRMNTANEYATAGGGGWNNATGFYSTVPGGYYNDAAGMYSFAAGVRAKANHDGSFVWADGNWADFVTTGNNQFLIRAAGGVGIGTNSPSEQLEIVGNMKMSGKATIGPNNYNYGDYSFIAGHSNTAGDSFCVVSGGKENYASTAFSSVGGGYHNFAYALGATVAGGYNDSAVANYSTIGGGQYNYAYAENGTIGGGSGNSIDFTGTTIAGGINNFAGGNSGTIAGGEQNGTNGDWSSIGGGYSNVTFSPYGGVSAGYSNQAGDSYDDTAAFVGGGYVNHAYGKFSTIGGGTNNSINVIYSTIGGGVNNSISGYRSTISGGVNNSAIGNWSVIGGGEDNTVNSSSGTIGGGFNNITTGSGATISGGTDNTINEFAATIGGGRYNIASGLYSVIGGGLENTANGDHAAISGGYNNITNDVGTFIGGGSYNEADSDYAVVSGGVHNQAGGEYSAIVCGRENSVTGEYGFIGGGLYNIVNGENSIVPMGDHCNITSQARHSLAFGYDVYIDTSFRIAFFEGDSSGHFGINRDDNDGGILHPLHIGTSSSNGNGAHVTAGGVWTNGSSRSFKENGRSLDGMDLLNNISNLNIESWNFIDSDERHIGPYAEEFVAAFNVGTIRGSDGSREDKYLAAGDVAGVALAGVKELIQENKELKDIIAQLEKRISDLEKQ